MSRHPYLIETPIVLVIVLSAVKSSLEFGRHIHRAMERSAACSHWALSGMYGASANFQLWLRPVGCEPPPDAPPPAETSAAARTELHQRFA